MPRQPDPNLEHRILDAAQALWKRGGEKALTMRAVARAAGSNTPAVYRRFRTRQQIVRGLLQRIQQEIGARVVGCQSVEEMGEVYLDYALSHRHEYELFFSQVREVTPRARNGQPLNIREFRPNLWLLQQRLAERFGGTPESHLRLALGVVAVGNGTALMVTSGFLPGREKEMRAAFTASMTAMLRDAERAAAK